MHFSDKANVAEKMARGKWNKTKIFTPSLHSCLLVAGDHLYSQMERGTVGIKRHICYHIGSNPDLKIRSPVKNKLQIYSFSNGTKENDKKETLLIYKY